MKIKAKWYRVLLKIMIAIVVILMLGVIAFVIATIVGRNRLYGDNKGKGPNVTGFEQVELLKEEDAENVGDSGYTWQEGDIRYQGGIYRYNEDILTFLFLGTDAREDGTPKYGNDDAGRADSIFLLVMNPHTEAVEIIAIPRDTIAEVELFDDQGIRQAIAKTQITMQYAYGDGAELSCERMQNAVSKLFYELPIHGYCAIHMSGIPTLNDAVGGIELQALQDVPKANIKAGEQVLLQGQAAYHYLHDRDTKVAGSAQERLARQKQYLAAYASKVREETKKDITLPVKLYNTLNKYMVTDVSVDKVSYLATQATNYRFDDDHIYSLEGELVSGEILEEFHVDENALYELILKVFYEKVTADAGD